jgi:hypothetical protein
LYLKSGLLWAPCYCCANRSSRAQVLTNAWVPSAVGEMHTLLRPVAPAGAALGLVRDEQRPNLPAQLVSQFSSVMFYIPLRPGTAVGCGISANAMPLLNATRPSQHKIRQHHHSSSHHITSHSQHSQPRRSVSKQIPLPPPNTIVL